MAADLNANANAPTDRDPPQAPVRPASGDKRMELWISYVLRVGVLTSGAIILLGVILFFVKGPGPGEPRSMTELLDGGGHPIATSAREIARGVIHGKAVDVILLGLLVLILTPLSRVAMTLMLFLRLRDWIFVLITATVLTILVIGLIGVGA
ncbi:MAG: DUF1634 domain-containing protein [Thermomicrobiales bacterium]